MADEKELVIRLKLDKSQADQATREHVAAEKKANQELLTDAQIAERAKLELIKRTNAQKVAEAARANKTEVELAREASREAQRLAKEAEKEKTQAARDAAREAQRAAQDAQRVAVAAEREKAKAAKEAAAAQKAAAGEAAAAQKASAQASLTAWSTTAQALMTGFNKVLQVAQGIGEAIKAAADKSREFAKGFSDQRDSLGELATLMGRENNNDFALDMAKFNVKTRMKTEEGKAFLTELYNSGAQFEGRNISKDEFKQFTQQSGQLATALGFDKAQTGNLAGTVLGFSDFNRFGEGASEAATAKLNSSLAILGHGKGRQPVLMNQMSMLGSAALNEDEMKGTFQDVDEVAAVISIAAEKHDAQAAELTKMASRGLRGFGPKDKQSTLLKRAGIGPQTGFIKSLEQLAPVVLAEAQKKGLKVEDVLRQNFEDEGTVDALAVFLNKGIYEGGFQERAEFGAQNAGPRAAFGKIESFKQGEAGKLRLRDAQVELAKAERGAKNSKLEILRREALGQLIHEGKIDSTNEKVAQYAAGAATFGLIGDTEQNTIDSVVQANLRARTPAEKRGFNMGLPLTHEGREEMFNKQMDTITASGVDPLTGRKLAAPGSGEAGAIALADPRLQETLDRLAHVLENQGQRNQRPGAVPSKIPSRPQVMH